MKSELIFLLILGSILGILLCVTWETQPQVRISKLESKVKKIEEKLEK